MHGATSLLPQPYLWPLCPHPPFLFHGSFRTFSLPPLRSSWQPPTQMLGWLPPLSSQPRSLLTSGSLQTVQNMSELWDTQELKQNTEQGLSVSLSVHPHNPGAPLWADKSNESGCLLRPWQKVWSLKCSHSQCVPCRELLCDNQY